MIKYIVQIIVTISILFLYTDNAFSFTRIFLHQNIYISEEKLTLNDIANIDTDKKDDLLNNIIIPSELYRDKLIDKREIADLIKNNSNELFLIYGNGVHIDNEVFKQDNGPFNDQFFDFADYYLIKKGDNVRFVINKKYLSIEVNAIALNDGRLDEEISVKLLSPGSNKTKKGKGRVRSNELVEADI